MLDVKEDPRAPKLVKVIEAEEIARKAGYSRPHTVHCGPDGIYVSALGDPEGDGPGGVFLLDHDDFSVKGQWEADRGPQELAYDFWWHLNLGTRDHVASGGRRTWSRTGSSASCCSATGTATGCTSGTSTRAGTCRRSTSARSTRWCSSCGPRTTRTRATGSSASSPRPPTCRPRSGSGTAPTTARCRAEKVITIPAEPADAEQLPPLLQPFGAVPPLITDIALSVDDRSLLRLLLGDGRAQALRRDRPARAARDRLGAARRDRRAARAHPAAGALNGGPQMVEVSRDGRRVFLTNSLYAAWDAQFYPEGIDGWLVKLDAGEDGSLTLDPDLFVEFSGERPHQVRLQGGDASSDSYCFPDPRWTELWPWVLMALLGAYHGLNPAMGWLFAVALGMQERDRGAVLRALPPIALGHEASVLVAAALVLGLGLLADTSALHMGAGIALVRVRRVPVRQAARALPLGQGARDARRARLVVVPDVDGARRGADGGAGAARRGRGGRRPRRRITRSPPCRSTACRCAASGLAALLHVGAMVLVMGVIAVLVYDRWGVGVLRRTWVNLDAVWAGAFVLAGVVTFFS